MMNERLTSGNPQRFFAADSKAEAIECADSQGIILDFEERAFQDRVGIVLTEGEEGFIDEVFKLFFRYGKSSMTLNFWHSRVSRTVATHDLEGSVAAGQGDDEFIIAGEFNIAVRHTMDDRDDLRVRAMIQPSSVYRRQSRF